jgi:hypothetical protein
MESTRKKNREFPDLEDGIYCFRGGYLIIEGESTTVLRHDDQYQNLEHLIKKYRFRKGPLTAAQLKKINLPPENPASGAYNVQKIRKEMNEIFKKS